MLVRTWKTAPKYRLPGSVRRVKLVTSGQIMGLNSQLFLQNCQIRRYKGQQATNHCFPPLYPTVTLQFRPIPHCMLFIPQKQSIPEVKEVVFHQKLHFLLVPMVAHPDPQLHLYKLPGYVRYIKTCYLGLFGKKNLLPIFFVRRRMSDTVCRLSIFLRVSISSRKPPACLGGDGASRSVQFAHG